MGRMETRSLEPRWSLASFFVKKLHAMWCRRALYQVIGMALLAGAAGSLVGCNYLNLRNSFLNPSEVGRFDKANPWGRVQPVTWPILDSLAVDDPPAHPWKDSVPPTAADLLPTHKPYLLGPGDVVTVSVFELVVPGQESVQTRQINTQGDITLDFIGTIHAAGLTTRRLRDVIIQKLIQSGQMSPPGPHQPGPQVNIALTEARRRVFSVIGAALHPGTYNIMSPDFRLLDALALAGDVPLQPGMRWLYVIRPESAKTAPKARPGGAARPKAGAAETTGTSSSPARMLEQIARRLGEKTSTRPAPSTRPTENLRSLLRRAVSPPATAPAPNYVYLNHHWVKMKAATRPAPAATRPVVLPAPPLIYNFVNARSKKPHAPLYLAQKIIRIPIKKLREGDPRYNIVIHAGDIINVPAVEPKYYYVMGNVNRPGVYSMTGQRITLKMAVAAAGNLGTLAIPRRCELIRRIGRNQETIIQVNLQAIFDGQEPDIFLKPNDVLNVGTDVFAYPLAVIRNGFAASYGFGFTYDRNFYIQPTIIQPP